MDLSMIPKALPLALQMGFFPATTFNRISMHFQNVAPTAKRKGEEKAGQLARTVVGPEECCAPKFSNQGRQAQISSTHYEWESNQKGRKEVDLCAFADLVKNDEVRQPNGEAVRVEKPAKTSSFLVVPRGTASCQHLGF